MNMVLFLVEFAENWNIFDDLSCAKPPTINDSFLSGSPQILLEESLKINNLNKNRTRYN